MIQHCNELAKRFGYEELTFLEGDISSFEGVNQVDMVVTLHACDTATDFALDKAIRWGAKVILSVPCCQHEVNAQLKNDRMQPIFKYGIIKERMAALMTDALRANLLEQAGYETQILEFIELEHTPKNLLIRAVKTDKKQGNMDAYKKVCDEFGISTTLARLQEHEGMTVCAKTEDFSADNTKVALRYMETILGDIYDVTLVQTGMSVLDCLKSEIPDLILMNANMFGMDGYEVLRRIKEDKETKEIPVILMMNVKDIQSELRGLEEGAIDFISLPFEPQVLKARIAHIVELSVLRKQQAHLIAKQKEQIDRLFLQSMVTIAHTVDAKDRYARRHSLRVALYCRGIAAKLGYSDKEKEALYYIALLHDIGNVSTRILF